MKSINDLLKRKKLIVFDLDDFSRYKIKYENSMNYTAKRNNIKIPFKNYFKLYIYHLKTSLLI